MKKTLIKALSVFLCVVMTSALIPMLLVFPVGADAVSETEPSFLYNFATRSDIVTAAAHVTAVLGNGYTTFTATEGDPYAVLINPTVKSGEVNYAHIEYRTTKQGDAIQLFSVLAGQPYDGTAATALTNLTGDGQWHTVIVDLTKFSSLNADYTTFRVDPLAYGNAGDSIDIKCVALFKTLEGAENYSFDAYLRTLKPSFIYDFTDAEDEEYFRTSRADVEVSQEDGFIRFDAIETGEDVSTTDPHIEMVQPVCKTNKTKYVSIGYKTSEAGALGEFYFTVSTEQTYVNKVFNWNGNGRWNTVTVDMSNPAFLGNAGNISMDAGFDFTMFRFDPLQGGSVGVGDSIDVKYIAFFETQAEADNFSFDAYKQALAEEKSAKEAQEAADKITNGTWAQPGYVGVDKSQRDNTNGSLKYVDNGNGTVTISYLLNGETVSYTVPNDPNYLSGPFAAVDDLGRSMYNQYSDAFLHETLGGYNQKVNVIGDNGDTKVGMFYFLNLGEAGDSGIYNMQTIMEEARAAGGNPGIASQANWGGIHEIHFFAEPLYGYYYSKDEWVMRKHMELLSNAGVDFIYFDASNGAAFIHNAKKLMQICHDMNAQGFNAPEVVFYTNGGATHIIQELYDEIYSQDFCSDTWFRLNGKPLVIYPDIDPATGNYTVFGLDSEVSSFFSQKRTVWPWYQRASTKPTDADKNNAWPWMDWEWPQEIYPSADSNGGAMNVSAAQHAVTGGFSNSALYGGEDWGRSYNGAYGWDNGIGLTYSGNNNKLTADSYKWGYNFQSEFSRAILASRDPSENLEFVLVTGWNEWTASRQPVNPMYPEKEVSFVDCCGIEYSRDLEMARGYYFDNYYMQLASNIQTLKGAAPTIVQDMRKTVNLTGGFDQWNNVPLSYRDPAGDCADRNARGFGNQYYTDESGRNDIVESKVTLDSQNLYFYIKTADTIQKGDGTFMNVYLNTDNQQTGWYGYDYVLNNRIVNDTTTTIGRFNADGSVVEIGNANIRVSGNEMMISVPLETVGITDYTQVYFTFKIADSKTKIESMENFYELGDVAPLGRMNYVFQNYIPGISKPIEPVKVIDLADVRFVDSHEGTNLSYDTDKNVLSFKYSNTSKTTATMIGSVTDSFTAGACVIKYRANASLGLQNLVYFYNSSGDPIDNGWRDGSYMRSDYEWHYMVIPLPEASPFPSWYDKTVLLINPTSYESVGKDIEIGYWAYFENDAIATQFVERETAKANAKREIIKSASVGIDESLSLNFYLDKATIDEATSFTVTLKQGATKRTITDRSGLEAAGDFYKATWNGIYAYNLGDKVTIEIDAYGANGSKYERFTYSVEDYCRAQLDGKISDEFRTLLVDLLNYGASAQVVRDYNVSALVNRGFEKMPEMHELDSTLQVTDNGSALRLDTSTVRLNNTVELVLNIQKKNASDTKDYYITVGGTTEKLKFNGNTAKYVYTVNLLRVNNEFAFSLDSGKLTVTYGVKAYGNRMYESLDSNNRKLYNSLLDLADSITAYKALGVAAVNGYVIDKFDLDTAMKPIWQGDTVYNESVIFIESSRGSNNYPAQSLMYSASEIVSVRSRDLKTEFVEGVDYVLEGGKIKLTANSRIPKMSYNTYYPIVPEHIKNGTTEEINAYMATLSYGVHSAPQNINEYVVVTNEEQLIVNYQVYVTYKHNDAWTGATPNYIGEGAFPKTMEKLNNGQNLRVVYLGDSITYGCNASTLMGVAPYGLKWADMVIETLKYRTGNNNITFVNNAVGGKDAAWGALVVTERVSKYKPDLLIIAFGINDITYGGLTADQQTANMKQLVDRVHTESPDTEILLVSPMMPNPDAFAWTQMQQLESKWQSTFASYDYVRIANLSSVYCNLFVKKGNATLTGFASMTGNNVNHSNDFLVRVYAQTVIGALLGNRY